MRLYPQPEVDDLNPRKGPMVASGTLSPDPQRLQVRRFGFLRGLVRRPFLMVPFTQGAGRLAGFGGEQPNAG